MEFPRDSFLSLIKDSPEEYKKATIDYADCLLSQGLPVIFSLKHLGVLLNVEYKEMCSLVHCTDGFYAYFLIKKRRGGYRRIVVPYENLKRIQRWILCHILSKVPVHQQCIGFVKGKNTLNNAKPHVGKEYIRKFDFKDFFESMNARQVYYVFRNVGYSPSVSHCLASLCTLKIGDNKYDYLQPYQKKWFKDLHDTAIPILPQGAPTSPALANIICNRLDKRFFCYAQKNKLTYTRYADDITFSCDVPSQLPKVSFVRKVVESEGLSLNDKKTGTYGRDSRQMVTGILIDGEKAHVPQKFRREIYRHLHFCKLYGAYEHFKHVAPDKSNPRAWLYGKIHYVNTVDPEEAKKMFALADELDWWGL
jgi:retron-type reverse transcriptase